MTNRFIYLPGNGGAFLLHADPEIKTLTVLQTLVEGLFTCVSANEEFIPTEMDANEIDIWVNDDGLHREDFVPNREASFLTGQILVGPAVVTRNDGHGATISLTDKDIELFVSRYGICPTISNFESAKEVAQAWYVGRMEGIQSISTGL